jgi:CDP-2,3-bis-(O-geranylgeranyl)-sn-glycerol synthase
MSYQNVLLALLLLGVANGTPLLGHRLFGARFAAPLDGGVWLGDGRHLFGPGKTIRGVVLSVVATALAAVLFGLGVGTGLLFGGLTMVGDLSSSFIKRRIGIPSGGRALGLDQLFESLFPLLGCKAALGLDLTGIAVLVLVFLVLALALSRLLYRFGIRARPN